VAAVRDALCPPGTLVAYMGTTAPDGWLLCQGQSVSRTLYNNLYTVIGNASGSADTASFNVPDLRGRFLRGVDGSAGRDPDSGTRTAMNPGGNTGNLVGSVQVDALKSHTHTVYAVTTGGGSVPVNGSSVGGKDITSSGPSTGASSETRPINAYVNYIIKY